MLYYFIVISNTSSNNVIEDGHLIHKNYVACQSSFPYALPLDLDSEQWKIDWLWKSSSFCFSWIASSWDLAFEAPQRPYLWHPQK